MVSRDCGGNKFAISIGKSVANFFLVNERITKTLYLNTFSLKFLLNLVTNDNYYAFQIVLTFVKDFIKI